MKRKRVIVLESEDLLGAGVFSLLSADRRFEVRRAWLGEEGFARAMAGFDPEVFVVEEETLARNLSICSRLFEAYPRIRVIVLNPGANTVKVCERQIVILETIEDFFEMV